MAWNSELWSLCKDTKFGEWILKVQWRTQWARLDFMPSCSCLALRFWPSPREAVVQVSENRQWLLLNWTSSVKSIWIIMGWMMIWACGDEATLYKQRVLSRKRTQKIEDRADFKGRRGTDLKQKQIFKNSILDQSCKWFLTLIPAEKI